jgi:hypothetical protein
MALRPFAFQWLIFSFSQSLTEQIIPWADVVSRLICFLLPIASFGSEMKGRPGAEMFWCCSRDGPSSRQFKSDYVNDDIFVDLLLIHFSSMPTVFPFFRNEMANILAPSKNLELLIVH